MNEMQPLTVNVAQAARIAGVSVPTMRAMIRKGVIRIVPGANVPRVAIAELERWATGSPDDAA
jgi:hypothetical protein